MSSRSIRQGILAFGWLALAPLATAFELPRPNLAKPRLTKPSLPGVELASFDTETPDVSFDVPAELVCRDVTTAAFAANHPGERLVRVAAPVTLLLFHGEADRVEDVVVEIDGASAGLRVIDYAPRTVLASELAEPIEVKATRATDRSFGASLGGKLSGDVALTPTLSGGFSRTESDVVTRSELPPKRAVVVSGAIGGRTGVYFKLRNSSQSTLEGERVFEVTFAAPADWTGGDIEVRCLARGERKWLWVEQRRVWSQSAKPVSLRLATVSTPTPTPATPRIVAKPISHRVAKPVVALPITAEPLVGPTSGELTATE